MAAKHVRLGAMTTPQSQPQLVRGGGVKLQVSAKHNAFLQHSTFIYLISRKSYEMSEKVGNDKVSRFYYHQMELELTQIAPREPYNGA